MRSNNYTAANPDLAAPDGETTMLGNLHVIYEHSADGSWTATIPEVPGAISHGANRLDARHNVIEAVRELTRNRREQALVLRSPNSEVEVLSPN
jgi:predicted RNase H-like HicB family nuclease